MYCQKESSGKKTYYVWNGVIGRFTVTGGTNYFETSNLDVEIKKYYNDGYTQTKDEYYNDGYRKSSKQTYNDGYKRRNITKTVTKKRGFMTDTKSNGRVVITRTMELCTISDKERVHHTLT